MVRRTVKPRVEPQAPGPAAFFWMLLRGCCLWHLRRLCRTGVPALRPLRGKLTVFCQGTAINVSEAVAARTSIRAFSDQPVDDHLLRELVEKAARAPSGGNLQPWRIFVLNGASTTRFLEFLSKRDMEKPAYPIYPPNLKEPYRSSRFKVGEDMYALLGIPREDKPARLKRVAENYRFFGAPAAIFCFVDKIMGPPQWSDLGMYLQTFMLLAQEAGLSTCAQESWSAWPEAVSEFVGAPEELTIFCGIAVGHADAEAPVNTLYSDREPVEQWATFIE